MARLPVQPPERPSGVPPGGPPPGGSPPAGPSARLTRLAPRALGPVANAARRRLFVVLAKRVLPVVAVALLALVALWPEFFTDAERGRFTYRLGLTAPEGGALTDARYRGVDKTGQPFTVTASLARQVGPERVDLTEPKGDITLGSGAWLLVRARQGVYMQRADQLDLSGEVVLYRDDGTVMQTDAMAVDLHGGAASGNRQVHVQGPFGTLDAQGFTLLDGGSVVQFTGPGRLVLNGGSR